MPSWIVTGPDGKRYRVETPEGASQEDAIRTFNEHMAPAAPQGTDPAVQVGRGMAKEFTGLPVAGYNLAASIPGVGTPVRAAGTLAKNIPGVGDLLRGWKRWVESPDESGWETAGRVGGALAGGAVSEPMLAARGAQLAGRIPWSQLRTPLQWIARHMAPGAVTGALSDPNNPALGAAMGAGVGGALPAVGTGLRSLADYADPQINQLARILGGRKGYRQQVEAQSLGSKVARGANTAAATAGLAGIAHQLGMPMGAFDLGPLWAGREMYRNPELFDLERRLGATATGIPSGPVGGAASAAVRPGQEDLPPEVQRQLVPTGRPVITVPMSSAE